jgi:ATP-binding cassette, subfamily C (CFTR/MRP), member 1
MAEPGEEKDYKTTYPIGAANNTNTNEPVASEQDDIVPGDSDEAITTLESIVKGPNLYQSKSYATTASAVSASEKESTAEAKKKPWYRNVNPLRWGAPPPAPQERTPSREYTAGFLSLMTFQWMAPLMTVSRIVLQKSWSCMYEC